LYAWGQTTPDTEAIKALARAAKKVK
jgi:hypothetical protein